MSQAQEREARIKDSEVRAAQERQEQRARWAADLVADKEVWVPLRELLVEVMEAAGAELEVAVEGYKLYRAQGCKEALLKVHNYIVDMSKIGMQKKQQDLEGKEKV